MYAQKSESASHDSWYTGTPFKEDNYTTVGRDGDVGSARYEPAQLYPMPDHKGFKLQWLSEIHPVHF